MGRTRTGADMMSKRSKRAPFGVDDMADASDESDDESGAAQTESEFLRMESFFDDVGKSEDEDGGLHSRRKFDNDQLMFEFSQDDDDVVLPKRVRRIIEDENWGGEAAPAEPVLVREPVMAPVPPFEPVVPVFAAIHPPVAMLDDERFALVLKPSRLAGLCGPPVDSSARSSSWSLTYFPPLAECPVGSVIVSPITGLWEVSRSVLDRFPGDVLPPEILRFLRHPDAKCATFDGQWEVCPETLQLHLQGCLQTFGPGKKSPGAHYRPTDGIFAAKIRACFADDEVMSSVDGLVCLNKPFRFHVEACISHPTKLKAYCTRLLNVDGSPKRAYGQPLHWSLNPSMSTEVRLGSTLCQVGSMVMGGVAPLEIARLQPGVGLQYWGNLNKISSAVREQTQNTGTLRRCLMPYCGQPGCTEAVGRDRAERLGITYNEYLLESSVVCSPDSMYLYGAAGTGKSSASAAVAHLENPEGYFVKPCDSYWGSLGGECYIGERGMLCHDVNAGHFAASGCLPYQNFKNIVDCTNVTVPIKNGSARLRVNKFYFDSNRCPCSFFLDLIGDRVMEDQLRDEYPAFSRRIRRLYYFSKSDDGLVSIIGQTMPTVVEFLRVYRLRRALLSILIWLEFLLRSRWRL